MGKKDEKENVATPEVVGDGLREENLMTDVTSMEAFKELEKEKDEKKKQDAKDAICVAVYNNRKTRAQLRARRREDDITKEKLSATKDLLERCLGVRTEIKDGKLIPTKEAVKKEDRLTLAEYKEAKRELEKKTEEKMRESAKQYDKDITELRNSLEGRYAYWWD